MQKPNRTLLIKNISDIVKEIGHGSTALECYDFPFMGKKGLGGFIFIDGKLQRIVFETPFIMDQSEEKTVKKVLSIFRDEKDKKIAEIRQELKNSNKPIKTKIELIDKARIKILQESDLPESLKNIFLIARKLSKKYGEGTKTSNFVIGNLKCIEMKYAEDAVILREFPINLQKSKTNKTGVLLIYTSKDYNKLLLQAQNNQLEDEL